LANAQNSQNKKLASALNFVSFLLLNLTEKEREEIKQILLLDAKIFVDALDNKELADKISAIAKQFAYPLDFSVGTLEAQKKPQASAFILYSRFQLQPKAGVPKTLISWEVIKPDSKRVLLNKRLFGYTQFGKFYPGLMQRYSAVKLGKGCISVSSQFAPAVIAVFKQMKIPFETKEVFEVA